jgi:hypothetical protein
MTPEQVQQACRMQLGLRIGLEMAQFVCRQIEAGADSISVLGGDARTGVAMSRNIARSELTREVGTGNAGGAEYAGAQESAGAPDAISPNPKPVV